MLYSIPSIQILLSETQKDPTTQWLRVFFVFGSDSSGDLVRTQAARAYVYGLRRADYDSLDASDVRLPGSVCLAV